MSALLDRPRLTVPVNENDHVLGPDTATITLVEYGDYECPFCGAAHVSMKELLRVAGDAFQYVFRHFPMSQIHPHALPAAEAAEAAGAQGRFWEMHDLLFTNQDRLGPQNLIGYAQALGLDLERFALEVDQHVHQPRIRQDFMSGIRSGVNGTPTFFISGVRHNDGYDLESLLAAVSSSA
jgi:protein-disulfide isomerase